MTMRTFNFDHVHPSWRDCLESALSQVDTTYLNKLDQSSNWLPGPEKIFNAFSLPVDQVRYVLFGESPYPRKESANGFAFWDAAVEELWSTSGLSKKVNRATSLRNMIKMLLVAEGLLSPGVTTQDKIASVNKSHLAKTNNEFFSHLLDHGFLLLNTTPVLQQSSPAKDARAWHPFTKQVLSFILAQQPDVRLLLFGNIAHTIDKLLSDNEHYQNAQILRTEHPYNISFITNQHVIDFFQPLHLLLTK